MKALCNLGCGLRHDRWVNCKRAAYEARQAAAEAPATVVHAPPAAPAVSNTLSNKRAVSNAQVSNTQVSNAPEVERAGKVDRKAYLRAYMREYMRKRRQAKAAQV